ncbi:hypothetical protein ACIGBL_30515 [Streptomyces sp. NPDC085614]|uniref:hypothetical protein n=1 Tax=Streptomyces sp. NPDC085614 TaxID=3365733 RepID=UPI0037D73D21
MKHHTTGRRAAATALLITTAVITGTACGPSTTDTGAQPTRSGSPSPTKPKDAFDGLSGEQISDKARTALGNARSLRFTGSGPDGQGHIYTMDISMDRTGSCRGKITQPDGSALKLIKKTSSVYLNGDEKFWRASLASSKKATSRQVDTIVKAIKGRWIKVDKKTAKAMTRQDFCELSTLVEKIEGDSGAMERGADIERAGRPVAVVYSREGTEVTTVHVAKTGEPYPVEISTTGGGELPSSIVLSEFDEPVDASPPAADQLLDMNKLRR